MGVCHGGCGPCPGYSPVSTSRMSRKAKTIRIECLYFPIDRKLPAQPNHQPKEVAKALSGLLQPGTYLSGLGYTTPTRPLEAAVVGSAGTHVILRGHDIWLRTALYLTQQDNSTREDRIPVCSWNWWIAWLLICLFLVDHFHWNLGECPGEWRFSNHSVRTIGRPYGFNWEEIP